MARLPARSCSRSVALVVIEPGDVIVFACKPTQLRTIAPGSRTPSSAQPGRAPTSSARARTPLLDAVAHLRWRRAAPAAVTHVAAACLGEPADAIGPELTSVPVMVGPYGELLALPARWTDAIARQDEAAPDEALPGARAMLDGERVRELGSLARRALGDHKRLYVWWSESPVARGEG